MDSEDLVDAGDAALQALLAGLAERTTDSVRRDRLLDFILTLPPLREWPTESLVRLEEAARSVSGQQPF